MAYARIMITTCVHRDEVGTSPGSKKSVFASSYGRFYVFYRVDRTCWTFGLKRQIRSRFRRNCTPVATAQYAFIRTVKFLIFGTYSGIAESAVCVCVFFLDHGDGF